MRFVCDDDIVLKIRIDEKKNFLDLHQQFFLPPFMYHHPKNLPSQECKRVQVAFSHFNDANIHVINCNFTQFYLCFGFFLLLLKSHFST